MTKPRLPRLTAEFILYGVSLANALRLAWAYATADANGAIFSLPGAFGLILGAMVSVGTAFVAGKLAARMEGWKIGKKRDVCPGCVQAEEIERRKARKTKGAK